MSIRDCGDSSQTDRSSAVVILLSCASVERYENEWMHPDVLAGLA